MEDEQAEDRYYDSDCGGDVESCEKDCCKYDGPECVGEIPDVVVESSLSGDAVFGFFREAHQQQKDDAADDAENGNYDIEAIVTKTLNSAPTRKDLVVYLHPEDFGKFQKLQQDGGSLSGVAFAEDANIGKAECRLESPKGKIASLIDEQLIQIEEALTKVE